MTTPRRRASLRLTLTVWLVLIAGMQLLATAALKCGVSVMPAFAGAALIVFGPWLALSQDRVIRSTRQRLLRAVKPRRRWFQFSLRTLMTLMLMAASFAAGWAWRRREADEAYSRARIDAERARKLEEALRLVERDFVELMESQGIEPSAIRARGGR